LAGAVQAGPVYTTATPLTDLLVDGAAMQVDDKLFDSFFSLTHGEGISDYDLANVVVEPLSGINPGLLFWTPNLAVGSNQSQLFFVSYNVSVLDPNNAIGAAQMLMVGGGLGSGAGTGVAKYIEGLVVPSNSPGVPFASLFTAVGDSLFYPYAETPVSPQLQAVTIQDVVTLVGGDGGAFLLKFAQTYEQVAVPEPATASLLLVTATVAVAFRWRRRVRSAEATDSTAAR
jgi:hypothetical protein